MNLRWVGFSNWTYCIVFEIQPSNVPKDNLHMTEGWVAILLYFRFPHFRKFHLKDHIVRNHLDWLFKATYSTYPVSDWLAKHLQIVSRTVLVI